MTKNEERLLLRIDFGLLISITFTLFTLWYFQLDNLYARTLVCAYMLMGAYLCYNKGKSIFAPTNEQSTYVEYTAWLFFNTWPYGILYALIMAICKDFINSHPFISALLLYITIFLIAFYKKRKAILNAYWVLSIWMFLGMCLSVSLMSSSIQIHTDQRFYNYTDNVYVSIQSSANDNVIIGFINENQEVVSAKKIKNGLYTFPAAVAYNQEVFAVRRNLFSLQNPKDDKFGDKEMLIKNSNKSRRKIKLDINVRYNTTAKTSETLCFELE
ncbi:MAG: hypothetical protein IJB23_03560 [Alistipes sp.]|nr:hypothetical protein [Alistipes sp.]